MPDNSKSIVDCVSCGQKLRIPTDRGHIKFPCVRCNAQLVWSPEPLVVEVEAVFDEDNQPATKSTQADARNERKAEQSKILEAKAEEGNIFSVIYFFITIGVGVFIGLAVFGFLPSEMSDDRRTELGALRIIGSYLVSIIAGFLAWLVMSSILSIVNKFTFAHEKLELEIGTFLAFVTLVAGFTFATTISFFHKEQWVQIPKQLIVNAFNNADIFESIFGNGNYFEIRIDPDYFKEVGERSLSVSELDEIMEGW